ncbi:SDR family oxidoreductase [Acetobacter malorum]|uniref:SDR family oxidoreductase n=1 Tax=Acetobacter malorum TaxID=178901 RepID=UPI00223159E4|nr:SDR family oxidoreductase [Acetobacter malorum]
MHELGKQVWAGSVGDAFREQILTGRFAQSYEIACAITYLISDAAAMVKGENLVVDGGYLLLTRNSSGGVCRQDLGKAGAVFSWFFRGLCLYWHNCQF